MNTLTDTATTADQDWQSCVSVSHHGTTYKPTQVYANAADGLTMGDTARVIGVMPSEFRRACKAYPVLRAAYDAGWNDWEADSLKRAELALARSAEGHMVEVEKVAVHKGVLTRYKERQYFPPQPASVAFKLERRDRERFGKDVRPDAPGVGRETLERVSLYLVEKGLGALQAAATPPQEAP